MSTFGIRDLDKAVSQNKEQAEAFRSMQELYRVLGRKDTLSALYELLDHIDDPHKFAQFTGEWIEHERKEAERDGDRWPRRPVDVGHR